MYSKDRKEWRDLLSSNKDLSLTCFPFQMKISSLRRSLSSGSISMEDAVDELWKMCKKYQRAVKSDLAIIFEN